VTELPPPTPPPTTRLPSQAAVLWTVEGLAVGAAVVVAALVLEGVLERIDGVPGWLPAALVACAVAWALFTALAAPQLRWRRWRYEGRDEELDLLHGTVTVVRTIVPVVRIQHVETRRTPLTQAFGLAAVRVHTAAGASEIPALREPDAEWIRDRIAGLAHVPDEL
jgi:membrane protein YdbS with pleckstrin-like domain